MTVSGVNNTTPTVTDPTATDATSAEQTLAGNFDTFLTLLTSQLQNQDPLSPMDSTQFTQQLVQFSGVEQQIKTNEELDGLVTQYKAASAGAALSYLGRDAIIESDATTMANKQALWAYTLDGSADTVKLTVRDGQNRDVFTTNGLLSAGEHGFTWNGKDNNGNDMP